MQVSKGGCVLHLSGHHGDCTPGSAVRIAMQGVDRYQQQLLAKRYKYARPGVEQAPWGDRELRVGDPSGNRLVFFEPAEG